MGRKMRIVAMNSNRILVQFFNPEKNAWKQKTHTFDEFDELMRTACPKEYDEYLKSGTTKSAADYFFHYGETPKMIRKGDAFVFDLADIDS